MNSIETNKLCAKIGDFELKDIDLQIPEGSIVGLIGRNGAGKTTLFKTLHGSYIKTSGDLKLSGLNYIDNEKEIRTNVAVVYDFFNGNPYAKVKWLRKIYVQSHPNFDLKLFDELIKRFNIDLKKRVSSLSLGMQKKLMLILAISVHPTTLLLDEPLIGIDPIDKQEFINIIQSYMENEKHSIIWSSHQIDDVQKIADYIAFMNEGEIVLFEDKETLLDKYKMITLAENDRNSVILINPKSTPFGVQGLVRTKDLGKVAGKHNQASLEQIFVHLCA
ncbi:ABC transporter ATP-binding protein YtrB [Candidatus Izimaplasma bacterium HR1]|uniref:ABC transporter ATP-binding protein n=1 Tax=Candidatus Izimoplasma sp. HR1 TaxID=1541959 RepID=UPI0004F6B207|nr:ABC transporter ATP-binding protein YtrB [Candidatus Izimaplasma bacterium HR1]